MSRRPTRCRICKALGIRECGFDEMGHEPADIPQEPVLKAPK